MKTCSGCQRSLPLEEFHRNRAHKDGRTTRCRACVLGHASPRRNLSRADRDDDGKTCPRCRDKVPWTGYAKNRAATDGHQTYCKPCSATLAKESVAKYEEAARLRWAEKLARTPASDGVKACRKCGETKPLLSFYAHRSTSDGRANYCMECQRAAAAEWRRNNADRVKANNARQQTDATLKKAKRASHRRWWLALYGLSVDQYEALLGEQEGLCAICRKPEQYIDSRTGRPRRLSVDHDHATGKVRGLLCGRCNRMLGYVADDPEALDRAAAYLRQA